MALIIAFQIIFSFKGHGKFKCFHSMQKLAGLSNGFATILGWYSIMIKLGCCFIECGLCMSNSTTIDVLIDLVKEGKLLQFLHDGLLASILQLEQWRSIG
jgi:hypothetical protein